MTDARSEVLALLAYEHARFLEQVERVPASRREIRAAPDQWSVAEIVEHVARIDRGITRLFEVKAGEPLTSTPDELAAARLTPATIARIRERSPRFDAPERTLPSGTISFEEAMRKLEASRAALVQSFAVTSDEVLDGSTHPHPIIGPLLLRNFMDMVAHHDARHAAQIAEIADQVS